MTDLVKLKTQRGNIKSLITRAANYVNKIDPGDVDSKVVAELNIRLSKIESTLDKFESIQEEIETFSEPPGVIDEIERDQFETNYYSLMRDIKHLISSYESLHQQNSSDSNSTTSSIGLNQALQQIKLPIINLPKFTGKYEEWVEFRDCFKALINDNAGISSIQKFYYLRSCLQKDALHIIESMQITAENYEIAWKMLSERYEQKELIIYSHLRSIFEYPSLTKESHVDLRNMFDTFTKNLRCLKTLGQPVDTWDTLIIYMLTSKLDQSTRREWELFEKEGEIPSIKDVNKFLKQRCEVLEKICVNQTEKPSFEKKLKVKAHSYVSNIPTSESSSSNPSISAICYLCKKGHTIFQCNSFVKSTPKERINLVKANRLCYNCLRPNHGVQTCTASGCRKCNRRHNTLLHLDNTNISSNFSGRTQNESGANGSDPSGNNNISTRTIDNNLLSNQVSVLHTSDNIVFQSQVLLSTALVNVQDSFGNFHQCRALLDSGSMSNFITEGLSNKLGLPFNKTNFAISGVGQSNTTVQSYVNVKFFSLNRTYSNTISCLVLRKITNDLPIITFNKNDLKIPQNLNLADPNFHKTGPIDLLLGSVIFWQLMCVGQVQLCAVTIQKTRLGWVLGGKLGNAEDSMQSISCCAVQSPNNESLDKTLTKFWTVEEINTKPKFSEAEQFCEAHFVKNLKRSSDNRFIVKIPLKNNFSDLGNSRELALSRFYSLERRLMKNERLRLDYLKFMDEYKALGHMTEITNDDDNKISYWLPHHAVIRESSLTTKLRVVFDASMKTDSGLSLNDVQFVGPTIQNELFSIVLRFRKYKYVMTADVSKISRGRTEMLPVEYSHLWNSVSSISCCTLSTSDSTRKSI
ncbi:uncharacterized protein LOC116178110 [Photinus pyralis]|uniref:uncharacterized protein LOC116178110 n=1 Tax=Photinus pyralis TaxID=7054 RepID=UPI0012673E0B|nr:uncharacterized protein LOC116178110 [Photinus pyralis]